PSYTQSSAAAGQSGYNLGKTFETITNVTYFTNFDAASLTSALQGNQILVLPYLMNYWYLDSNATTVLTNFVNNGGSVWFFLPYPYVNYSLQVMFGVYLNNLNYTSSATDPFTATSAVAGTIFDGGPTTLPSNSNDGSYCFYNNGLPTGSHVYYGQSNYGYACI